MMQPKQQHSLVLVWQIEVYNVETAAGVFWVCVHKQGQSALEHALICAGCCALNVPSLKSNPSFEQHAGACLPCEMSLQSCSS